MYNTWLARVGVVCVGKRRRVLSEPRGSDNGMGQPRREHCRFPAEAHWALGKQPPGKLSACNVCDNRGANVLSLCCISTFSPDLNSFVEIKSKNELDSVENFIKKMFILMETIMKMLKNKNSYLFGWGVDEPHENVLFLPEAWKRWKSFVSSVFRFSFTVFNVVFLFVINYIMESL